MNRHAFSACHPAISFIFFALALIFGMFFMHPAFLACSVLMSASLYVTVKRRGALKRIAGMLPLLAAIALINPVFNKRGETVLFMYIGARPYTAESLCYGIAIAAMLASVLLWFASYNEIMTSDKFTYIFGAFMPSITLVFTMVLRFVPNYRRKIMQISSARASIGKGTSAGGRLEIARNSVTIISALTSWALEGSVITSDSMRSRGYGTGRRGRFAQYRMRKRDTALIAMMAALAAAVVYCAANGAAFSQYTPDRHPQTMRITPLDDPYLIAGICSYALLLCIPTVLFIREEIVWLISRSKI